MNLNKCYLACSKSIHRNILVSVGNGKCQGGAMSDSKKLLGCRISYMRKKSGLSQLGLAQLLGIDRNSVSRIERGVHYPSLETLEKISGILNVEMRDFFVLKKTDNVMDMRTFLIQAAFELGEAELNKVIRAAMRAA